MTLNASADIRPTDRGYQLSLYWPAQPLNFRATELCFSLLHPLDADSLEGAQLTDRQGDWHRLTLDTPWDGREPLRVRFQGAGQLRKLTDRPSGLYLQNGSERQAVVLPGEPERQSPIAQPLRAGELYFLPQPQHLNIATTALDCPAQLAFHGNRWNLTWLQRLLDRLPDAATFAFSDSGFSVREQHDTALNHAFRLNIGRDGMVLTHRDSAGFQTGQAYLMQYLLQWTLAGTLPACELAGTPRFGYRGVHLDVVRHFFDIKPIQGWLDLFALFQFNHFHWHLTDDDGWRVASNAYPQLAQTAAWRGPDEALPPQMGSGAQRYGGCYSAEQIRATVQRATELGITVVPEMDVPGHCRALLKALPELVEADDQSVYRSVQHHNDNVINPALPATQTVIRTLINEWCDLFSGPLFHLGSDEVPEGAWLGSPAAQAWAEQQGRSPHDLHGVFMAELEQAVQARGKTAMGWEEIRTGNAVSTDTWVLSWQGVSAGQKAAEAGHPVVMTPAQHCYFDLAVSDRPEDPGYYWAGTVDLATAWHYQPTDGLSDAAASNVKGVQACLWTEVVTTPSEAEFMWFPRLLATAEVAWGSHQYDDFEAFNERAVAWMNRLAHLGVHGRDAALGW
ncbi:beta-N-acetylhexosaminidase [Saccharospirillum mangrovi]|uniref:beta-N-acetylhexosaminidase n=1 Tax=Saccharospirillum mangrovi TaxID=2161747 RepID=UPI000D332624|nr:family 20 glycosylhydrolase [Saccharospirillum mangrovi]